MTVQSSLCWTWSETLKTDFLASRLIFYSCFLRDRLRTSVNVLGDSFGAGVIAYLCRYDLAGTDKLLDNEIVLNYDDIELEDVETKVTDQEETVEIENYEYSTISERK